MSSKAGIAQLGEPGESIEMPVAFRSGLGFKTAISYRQGWRSVRVRYAGVAQLVEQLICNQWVGSSILSAGTKCHL
jgi:hypothetical protein